MRTGFLAFSALLAFAVQASAAQKQAPPSNGPKATVIRDSNLYVSPDTSSSRLAEISPGREMVVLEKSGPWVKVFANTDEETSRSQDAPVFGHDAAAVPVSGWMAAAGVVSSETPKGDLVLFGAAASQEKDAMLPHAPQSVAQGARLLYQRMTDLFPQSPLTPEAAWRSADIRWQLQKADIMSLPSAHEKDAYLRESIDDEEMRKLKKNYPRTKWADLADWDMLDNKVCGDWQGSTKCPEKEAEMYEKYAQEHPESPKAPEALYNAVYRQGALSNIYTSNGDDKKAGEAKNKAVTIAGTVETKYPQSDYAARAASLVYQLQESIPIYGTDSSRSPEGP
jgi:outer membrane protein assembly factor BamD (BamD/ComL family)